ncbi:right-handed parallel beta-helix repeat-containing protein [bacterium]|nr:MAG: right-handed parallel beta-helix repeat-containing protein [bacterium]
MKYNTQFRAAAVVLLIGTVLLGYMVVQSFAAGPMAAFEPETGTLTAGATVQSATGASGSGVVRFATAATPTPTGTPAAQYNCIASPHVCGYPDETNTGVPAGVSLTPSSSITITQNGTVINGLNINGEVIIRANNVTIKNTRITSGDYYPIRYFDNDNTGLLIEDSEIIGTNSNVTAGISFANYTLRRVEIYGAADGIKADGDVLIEDSYVHNLSVGNDTHNDGIQTTGGNNVTIRHTTCKLSTTNGANACIQMGNESGQGISNWLVENNLFDGGGWTINAGQVASSTVFRNNRFTRNAGYGPVSISGATWQGNYFDDNGAQINP